MRNNCFSFVAILNEFANSYWHFIEFNWIDDELSIILQELFSTTYAILIFCRANFVIRRNVSKLNWHQILGDRIICAQNGFLWHTFFFTCVHPVYAINMSKLTTQDPSIEWERVKKFVTFATSNTQQQKTTTTTWTKSIEYTQTTHSEFKRSSSSSKLLYLDYVFVSLPCLVNLPNMCLICHSCGCITTIINVCEKTPKCVTKNGNNNKKQQ